MAGLKIRTFPGEVFRAWWADFGAAPTAIPLPEMMPSLVTGRDRRRRRRRRHRDRPPAAYPSALSDVDQPHGLSGRGPWRRRPGGDGLPQDERDTISAAISEAQVWAIETQTAAETDIIARLEADGAVVNHIDTAPFRTHAEGRDGAVHRPRPADRRIRRGRASRSGRETDARGRSRGAGEP